jgi:hypothetical protein
MWFHDIDSSGISNTIPLRSFKVDDDVSILDVSRKDGLNVNAPDYQQISPMRVDKKISRNSGFKNSQAWSDHDLGYQPDENALMT